MVTLRYTREILKMTSNMVRGLRAPSTVMLVFVRKYTMENGKTANGQARERSSIIMRESNSSVNLQMARRMEKE